MEEYIKNLKVCGIDWNKTSGTEKEIVEKYYKEGISAKICAKHLVFPW